MIKEHNNLNVENLVKTKWFNQFNELQQEQIKLGLEKQLDVSIYAKKDFTWEQMVEIREGLEKNVDISIYAKEGFKSDQMFYIKEGLKNNLDIS